MSLLSEFNASVAGVLPGWMWDWLQVLLGLAVVFGVMFQRAESDRFQKSNVHCRADSITTWVGQIALSGIGTLAFLVAIDGLLPAPAPPRTFVVLFLASYFAVQIRVIYQVVARRWHLHRQLVD